MIHANQQIGTHRLDVVAQRRELSTVAPVARKQDHAAGERMGQAAAIGGAELGAGDIENEGGVRGHALIQCVRRVLSMGGHTGDGPVVRVCSTITKLAA